MEEENEIKYREDMEAGMEEGIEEENVLCSTMTCFL